MISESNCWIKFVEHFKFDWQALLYYRILAQQWFKHLFVWYQTKFTKCHINFVFSRIALPQGFKRRIVKWLQKILNDTTFESGSCCCHVTVWPNWIWFLECMNECMNECSAQILQLCLFWPDSSNIKFRSVDVHKITWQRQCHLLLI